MSLLSARAFKPLLIPAAIADPVSGGVLCANCGDKAPALARGSQILLACSKSKAEPERPSIRDQLAWVWLQAASARADIDKKNTRFIVSPSVVLAQF